jgi:hypothetical protein
MNVEIGTEATQFPEKEYFNGIFVAVRMGERRGVSPLSDLLCWLTVIWSGAPTDSLGEVSVDTCLDCLHCEQILIYVFPEKELRGLSPNFHIHVSVSDLYIPTFGRQTDQGNI